MSGLNDALRLAETLCARVCHDLSGPLGTLGGMLEMLQEEAAEQPETLTLASDAAESLQRRIQCLRAAWGSNPGPLSIATVTTMAEGLPGANRLTVDLRALPPGTEFPAEIGRALLSVMLMAADSLPVGGRIAVMGSATDLIVRVEGPKAAWPAGLPDCLRDDAAILSALDQPRGLAMPIAILIARNTGVDISLLLATGRADGAPPPLRLRQN